MLEKEEPLALRPWVPKATTLTSRRAFSGVVAWKAARRWAAVPGATTSEKPPAWSWQPLQEVA